MQLLIIDKKELEACWPGALAFIEAAERRHHVMRHLSTYDIDSVPEWAQHEIKAACKDGPDWFVKIVTILGGLEDADLRQDMAEDNR